MNRPEAALQCLPAVAGPLPRHATRKVAVRWGARIVQIGGGAPVVVQSMTNTDTADAVATATRSRRSRAPARRSCASR